MTSDSAPKEAGIKSSMSSHNVVEQVREALARQQRVGLHSHPIAIALNDDASITLEGEVADVAARKLALQAAASVPGVSGIVDRLRVAPVEQMGDGEIRDHVRDAISADPVFLNYEIRSLDGLGAESKPASAGACAIFIVVNDGVVTLDGVVASLSHKRLAGALAWWVPGTRDVIDGLEVQPPQPDSDDEISDALALVLEKDPLVNADEIRASTRDRIVTLNGLARNEQEGHAAETDAWCLFGVNNVINRLVVR